MMGSLLLLGVHRRRRAGAGQRLLGPCFCWKGIPVAAVSVAKPGFVLGEEPLEDAAYFFSEQSIDAAPLARWRNGRGGPLLMDTLRLLRAIAAPSRCTDAPLCVRNVSFYE